MDGALLVTILLSLGSLLLVVLPFLRAAGRSQSEVERSLLSEKVTTLQLLADLEHDRETGKLTDEDYQELRESAEKQAIAAMKRLDDFHGVTKGDPLEKMIRVERARLQKEGMR